jgi:type IV secretory pathway VirB2 component (pilin)
VNSSGSSVVTNPISWRVDLAGPIVVGVDVLFFRHQFWERLMVNVGIVLVFAAFGLRFLKRA